MNRTPTPWTLGVILKRSQTAYIDALHYDPDLMHQDWEGMIECCGCHDSPHKGIEKAEVNARFIVKAVNHHDPITDILKRLVADYDHYKNDEIGHDDIEWIVSDARKLLAELEKGDE